MKRIFRIAGPFASSICGSGARDIEDGDLLEVGVGGRSRRIKDMDDSPLVLFVDNRERGMRKEHMLLKLGMLFLHSMSSWTGRDKASRNHSVLHLCFISPCLLEPW